MVLRRIVNVISLASILLCAPLWAAVIAKVDRNQISLNESLQFVVSFDQRPNGNTPDTSGLTRDFDILGTSQSSRQTYINGQSEISTEWIYTLAPKREGNLIIPSVTLNGEATEAIAISVSEASKQVADASVFLESELDHQQAYVQQQIILKLKVYHAVSLGRNASLSEPAVNDAIVNKLKETEYQTRINGREYRVFEQRFAIFPQKSGKLEIPASILTATIPTRRNRNMFDPFNIDGQAVRIRSDAYSIDVLPQPKNYTGSEWLPADNVRILDDWNGSDLNISLGQSVTRTITTVAEGLLGAQLPPLPAPEVAGLKIYADQAEVSDGEGDKIVGSRTQSYALIATKVGQFVLPEQTLEWWDTNSNQQRKATLPAVVINVINGPATTTPKPERYDPGQVTLSPPTSPLPEEKTTETLVTDNDQQETSQLKIALAAMTLLWLLTTILWIRAGRKGSKASTPKGNNNPTEQSLLNALKKACKNQHGNQCLDHLLAWGQLRYGCGSLKELRGILRDNILNQQIDIVEAHLYRASATGDLANAFATIATRMSQIHAATSSISKDKLPPLYR